MERDITTDIYPESEDEKKDTVFSYADEMGDDDYDYVNHHKHSSYDDEYYD